MAAPLRVSHNKALKHVLADNAAAMRAKRARESESADAAAKDEMNKAEQVKRRRSSKTADTALDGATARPAEVPEEESAGDGSPDWTPRRSKADRITRPGMLVFPVTPGEEAAADDAKKAAESVHTRREQLQLQAPKAKAKAKSQAKAKAGKGKGKGKRNAPSDAPSEAPAGNPPSDAPTGNPPSDAPTGNPRSRASRSDPAPETSKGKGGKGHKKAKKGGRESGESFAMPTDAPMQVGDDAPAKGKGKRKGSKGKGAKKHGVPKEVMDVLQEDDVMMRMSLDLLQAMKKDPSTIPTIEHQENLPKYTHWRLSIYWTRNTVGILRCFGPKIPEKYCGTLNSGGSGNISVALEAADHFVTGPVFHLDVFFI